ncbi:hypothetical protein [Cereibacter changlensis]|uniref:hypothetical protein n=1 Tax=Cereibacter changlensis TaxID=402884 RepID=UPI0040339580
MTRYIIPALLALSLALGGGAWFWQRQAAARGADLREARATISQRDAVIEQHRRAAEVYRAHLKRMEDEVAAWAALETDLEAMEGRDADLSDHLRAASERLWRRN